MRTNQLAICLGCVGLVIGSAGLAYQSIRPSRAQSADPLFVAAGRVSVPAQAGWPSNPATAAVAFHDEMIELLTPRNRSDATTAQALAPEAVRDGAAERRQARPTRAERRRGWMPETYDARVEPSREPDRSNDRRYIRNPYYRGGRAADAFMDRAQTDRAGRQRDITIERPRRTFEGLAEDPREGLGYAPDPFIRPFLDR